MLPHTQRLLLLFGHHTSSGAAVGLASGTSTAEAVGTSVSGAASVGLASGTAAAAAVGSSVSQAVGSSSGTSAAAAVALLTFNGVLTPGALPMANSVIQRDTRTGNTYSRGTGAVPLDITSTTPLSALEYQAIDATTLTPVDGIWRSVTGLTASTAAQRVYCSVPGYTGYYKLKLRPDYDNAAVITTTAKFAVNEVVFFSGSQSLFKAAFFNRYNSSATGSTVSIVYDSQTLAVATITPNADGLMYASAYGATGAYATNAINWTSSGSSLPLAGIAAVADSPTTGYTGSGAAKLLAVLVSQTGGPVLLVGFCVGGTSLADWHPSTGTGSPTNYYTAAVNNMKAVGDKFGTYIGMIGHTDAGLNTGSAGYVTGLQTITDQLALDFPVASGGMGAAFYRAIGTIGALFSAGSAGQPAAVGAIRQGGADYAAADNIAAGFTRTVIVPCLDTEISTANAPHTTTAGGRATGAHFANAILGLIGVTSQGDAGPVITGITRLTATTLEIAVTQPSGSTAFTSTGTAGNLNSQFKIFPTGFVSDGYTITTTDISVSNKITLTHATIPEGMVIDVYYRYPFDATTAGFVESGSGVTSGIYDNNTPPTGGGGSNLPPGRMLAWTQDAAYIGTAIGLTTTPGTPTSPIASATNELLAVNFIAPDTGNVTSYDMRTSPDNATWGSAVSTGDAKPAALLVGQAASTAVFAQVRAVNAGAGTPQGSWSASATVTTLAGAAGGLPAVQGGTGSTVKPFFRFSAGTANALFTSATFATPQTTNAGTVGGVLGIGGSGARLIPQSGSGGASPTLSAASQNGLNGIRFTRASTQGLQMAAGVNPIGPLQTSSMTIAGAFKAHAASGDLLSFGPAGLVSQTRDNIYIALGTSGQLVLHRATASADNTVSATSMPALGTLLKFVAVYDSVANAIRIATSWDVAWHTASVTGAVATASPWTDFKLGFFSVSQGSNLYADATVYELIVWPCAVTGTGNTGGSTGRAGEIDSILDYLDGYWGS